MTTLFNRRRRNVIETRSWPSTRATWMVVIVIAIAMAALVVHLIARFV